ncbi:hypothetical protein Tco_0371273 [Tanacetum coccineum]
MMRYFSSSSNSLANNDGASCLSPSIRLLELGRQFLWFILSLVSSTMKLAVLVSQSHTGSVLLLGDKFLDLEGRKVVVHYSRWLLDMNVPLRFHCRMDYLLGTIRIIARPRKSRLLREAEITNPQMDS